MTYEWTLYAAVGLLLGFGIGTLIELKYIVRIDKNIEELLNRIHREEEQIETKVSDVAKKKKAKKKK